ncbi:putative Ig domain-containing protein, partial [Puniceicoccaceae bacterium K14]|nr:putative Ig domain-containing protein [Puniceicoccaceae bacterium K14]
TLENGAPLPDWLTIDSETGELSGTPENGDVGDISIMVTASDGQATASDTFTLSVENTNDGPTVSASIADVSTDEDSAFSLDVSGNFADEDLGDTLTYSATLENGDPLPGWITIDSDTGELSVTPKNGDVGDISITVTASDGEESASDTFSVSVENTNDGPTVVSQSQQALWKEDFSGLSDGAKSDSGDSAWATDESATNTSPIHGVANEAYEFSTSTSQANDNDALLKLQSEPIDISRKENLELTFELQTNGDMEESGSWHDYFQVVVIVDGESHEIYEQDGNHADGNGAMHSITLSNIPQGDELIISFEAKTTNSAEIFTIDNVQLNGDGVGLSDTNASEDNLFALDTSESFSDEDIGDTLTFSATLENDEPLPDWLTIDSETGVLSGIPENGDVGDISITVTASDGETSASDTFTLTIENTNDGPTVTSSIADQSTDEDSVFSLDVSENFADEDLGDTLTYSATLENGDPLPDWILIDSETGELSGTPGNGDVGDISITVTASDGEESASDTFTVSVENTNDGPVANADTSSVTEQNTVEIDVLANDTDIDAGDSLTISEASVPSGQGSVTIVGNKLVYDPEDGFPDLAMDDTENVEISYTISDEKGGISTSTVTVTVTGDDSLIVDSDSSRTVNGTDNNNTILGNGGNDTINAEGGDDVVVGGTGNDNMYGGEGNDTFQVSEGDGFDDFYGGEGDDTIVSMDGSDIRIDANLTSDNSIETISSGGNEGVNIVGDGSSQTLDFSETKLDGIQSIDGGAGNDNITGSTGDDTIIAGEGNDNLYGGEGNDTFQVSEGQGDD